MYTNTTVNWVIICSDNDWLSISLAANLTEILIVIQNISLEENVFVNVVGKILPI